MKFLIKIFIFFNCVTVLEIKNLNTIVDRIIYYLTSFNLIKLFIYKLGFKNINPINLKSFKNFINEKKIPLINKNPQEKDEIILVENFINVPTYTYPNLVCALFLKKLYNFKIYGLLRRGDIKAEILFRKFNINNIIYIDEPSFFNRIKYIIKAINFSNHPITIKKFCKLKYKDTDIGLSTYDSYIRYKKIPSEKNTNIQILCMLAQAMCKCDQMISKVFSNKKIKKIVQSEIVFSPLHSLFQLSLLNNVEVYSKTGAHKISIRKYNNTNQMYTYKYNISNKLFNRVYKTKKKQTLILFKKNYLQNLDKDKFGNIDFRMPNIKLEKKLIKKKDIFDYLQMKKKPIVCFFLNHLIDGNFHSGPMVNFQDTLTWFKFVFNEIKKHKKVNWIIKLHPTEKYYHTKFDLISIIKKLEKEHDHIKLYPDELSNLTLIKSVDVALTSHGTVGFEYPAYVNILYFEVIDDLLNIVIRGDVGNMDTVISFDIKSGEFESEDSLTEEKRLAFENEEDKNETYRIDNTETKITIYDRETSSVLYEIEPTSGTTFSLRETPDYNNFIMAIVELSDDKDDKKNR